MAPSQAVDSDPLLRDLPADATLVAGANLRLVRQGPLFDAWLEATGTDLDSLERSLAATTGLQAGSEALNDLRVGCGSGGCAGLIAGDLGGFSAERTAQSVNRVADHIGVVPDQRAEGLERPMALATAKPDLAMRLPRGEAVAMRRIAPDRALFGDEAAVTMASATDAQDLDTSSFKGAVPAGDMWLAMRDADSFFEQAAARLEQNGSEKAMRLAERLRRPEGPHRRAAEKLSVVAFAFSGSDPMTVRARATCRNTVAALTVEQMTRAALLRVQLGGATEAVRRAAADSTVVRQGDRVEVSLTWNADAVLAAIEEAREVRK